MYYHAPVMLKEVIKYLEPRPGQNFVDCTVGGGGHALVIARKVAPEGKVLGIDLDAEATGAAKSIIKKHSINNIILVNDNYKNLTKIIHEQFNYPISSILLDLGLSSAQLKDEFRGFSFQADGKLDMRYDVSQKSKVKSLKSATASDIVNRWSEDELVRIFKEFGEEPKAKRIAKEIVKQRKIKPIITTFQLSKIIIFALRVIPRRGTVVGQRQNMKSKKSHSDKGWDKLPTGLLVRGIHPATRVFQALRIAVNNEIENLKQTLPQTLEVLEPGGRLAIISFHSLEDRIVKNFFRQESKDCICPPSFPICTCGHKAQLKLITKKPVTPSPEEVETNPRSRSAKLRVAEKQM